MNKLADQIAAELQSLCGEPLSDSWRAADMQIFEFGRLKKHRNRRGDQVESADLKLHVQCRWRMVDANRILFGRDDLLRPADSDISVLDFDWDKQLSILDVTQREWFAKHRDEPARVVAATGDRYGGCRIELERGFALELFPCCSDREEHAEHWRLFGHRQDGSHFVVTGSGIAV